MSDVLTPEQRSRNMKSVKGKDTRIEVILRNALWNKGIRYRKNYKDIPGHPDIALTKYKIAIFCDEEFFHGKDLVVLRPKLRNSNNGEFWISIIARNRERDDEVNKQLLYNGWTVIRFLGNNIKKHTDECVKVIEECIFEIKIDNLEVNCIPENVINMNADDYEQFLVTRRALMAQKVKKYYNSL